MVLDSSALVAITLLEANWRELSAKAIGAPAIVAAPALLDTHLVLRSRLGNDALSKVSGQPLLYVGDDFSETDLRPA